MRNNKFDISISSGVASIERVFEFQNCTINLHVNLLVPTDARNPTLVELHQQCLDVAIAHLQSLKPPPQA